jgi:hypothetical protein
LDNALGRLSLGYQRKEAHLRKLSAGHGTKLIWLKKDETLSLEFDANPLLIAPGDAAGNAQSFEDKEHTRMEPKTPGEDDYSFYDSRARPGYDDYRARLNGWPPRCRKMRGAVYECPKCGYNSAGPWSYNRIAPPRTAGHETG